jgi:hypothetical protein
VAVGVKGARWPIGFFRYIKQAFYVPTPVFLHYLTLSCCWHRIILFLETNWRKEPGIASLTCSISFRLKIYIPLAAINIFELFFSSYYFLFVHRTEMIGGDVSVGFYDTNDRSFRIQDYTLTDKAQVNNCTLVVQIYYRMIIFIYYLYSAMVTEVYVQIQGLLEVTTRFW